MPAEFETGRFGPRVLLVGPHAPPYGGMALQAQLMLELMQREGVGVIFLPSNPPFRGRLRFLERLRGIRPFLRSGIFCQRLWTMIRRVEVIHILACSGLYFFVVVCPAVLLGRFWGKRIVLNYHGGLADRFFRWKSPLLAPFFRMADAVTAPSAFLAEVIGRRIGVPAEVIPNVVPLDVFHYRTRNPVQPKMLVTRHLEKLYDIESVMRAFREVQQFYPEASLWIAGTGSQEEYLRGLVSAWYLKNVRFLGYVPFKDLSAIYDQCDILINASRADNFPGSLLEGAAAGLVVISTGVGGIPHVFEHGKNALLVDPGDWEGLASSVVRVIETPELGPRLAQEALRQCLRYDWSAVRLSLYQIYGFSPPGIAERNACRQDHLAATEPHMQRFESRDR